MGSLGEAKKSLVEYYNNISDARSKIQDMLVQHSSLIEERSIFFSQFLYSAAAAILAIFLSVDNFYVLIKNFYLFYAALGIYGLSLLIFFLRTKEKIDWDSKQIDISFQKSSEDFNENFAILEIELKNGINMERFHNNIKKRLDEPQPSKDMERDYSLEFYVFTIITVFFFVTMSLVQVPMIYLILGLVILFLITHSQKQGFYKILSIYSKFVDKIFKDR